MIMKIFVIIETKINDFLFHHNLYYVKKNC